MAPFMEGILLLGGTKMSDLSFREWINVSYARALRDSPPELSELVSQLGEVESEAEMDAVFSTMRSVNAALGREADKYLADKGVRRRAHGHDIDAIEDDFVSFLEAAKSRDGTVGSPGASPPE